MPRFDGAAPSLLLLIAVGVVICGQLGVASFGRDDCTDMNVQSCECAVLVSEYEISCPGKSFNPKFKITIRPGSAVQVECNISNYSGYADMPHLRIGSIKTVQIRRCPLPQHLPISSIMEELGIVNTKWLIFEGNDLGMDVTRSHLKHLKNLQRLRFAARRMLHIPEDLMADMHHLNWLDMRAANLAQLPARLLANMTNLEFLELGSNNLRQLPRGIFNDLHKIQHLNLWSNQLHNLSKHDFEGAYSVKDIDLHNNGIEQLRPDVFALLTNLTEINLNGNNFRSLPEGLFSHNQKLQQVKLQYNKVPLSTLPSRLFANLSELRTLYIRCDLQTIPADLLTNSTGLINITLMENLLSSLPAHLFDDQVNLINLDLHKNRLKSLPDGIFDSLTQLDTLNLSENQLTEISSNIFIQLRNLRVLKMHDNRIKRIHNHAFISNMGLREINLSNNLIDLQDYMIGPFGQFQGSPFGQLHNISILNLRNNSVMQIFSDWILSLNELQQLDLSYNNLTDLKYEDLNFLSKYDLSINLTHNQIRSVYFHKHLLSTPMAITVSVDLNDNPLYCDCSLDNFSRLLSNSLNLEYARNLVFTTDRLSCHKPKSLENRLLSQVDPMDLLCEFDQTNDTAQKKCPNDCECYVRTFDLTLIVNCSNGDLTEIPKLPELPPSLHNFTLILENNKILELPAHNTLGYENVTTLRLAGNNLTQIDALQLPRKLTSLDVRNNQIPLFNFTLISHFNKSRETLRLRLSQNPIRCDCDAKDLLTFMNNEYTVLDYKDIICEEPELRMGQRLTDLSRSELCLQSEHLLVAVIVIISMLGFLIGISAAFYFKYEDDIKTWMFLHGYFVWCFAEEYINLDKKFDAFVSYSDKDRDFVMGKLVARLEKMNFKLCLHERDWVVGAYIPDSIARSIEDSRRTIIVLSDNFLQSTWATTEFDMAYKALYSETKTIIPIIYTDFDQKLMPKNMKTYCSNYTYLKWTDPRFWSRLVKAMRDPKPKKNWIKKLLNRESDQMELIKPSPVTPPLSTPPANTPEKTFASKLNGCPPQTVISMPNGNGLPTNMYAPNGNAQRHHHIGNGHINGAFTINSNAKQSDV